MDNRGDADPSGVLTVFDDLDQATADLFDLDMRVGPAAGDLPSLCSADCTSDGCSRPTRPC
jgi:hypothetical protein